MNDAMERASAGHAIGAASLRYAKDANQTPPKRGVLGEIEQDLQKCAAVAELQLNALAEIRAHLTGVHDPEDPEHAGRLSPAEPSAQIDRLRAVTHRIALQLNAIGTVVEQLRSL